MPHIFRSFCVTSGSLKADLKGNYMCKGFIRGGGRQMRHEAWTTFTLNGCETRKGRKACWAERAGDAAELWGTPGQASQHGRWLSVFLPSSRKPMNLKKTISARPWQPQCKHCLWAPGSMVSGVWAATERGALAHMLQQSLKASCAPPSSSSCEDLTGKVPRVPPCTRSAMKILPLIFRQQFHNFCEPLPLRRNLTRQSGTHLVSGPQVVHYLSPLSI